LYIISNKFVTSKLNREVCNSEPARPAGRSFNCNLTLLLNLLQHSEDFSPSGFVEGKSTLPKCQHQVPPKISRTREWLRAFDRFTTFLLQVLALISFVLFCSVPSYILQISCFLLLTFSAVGEPNLVTIFRCWAPRAYFSLITYKLALPLPILDESREIG
jgi:hypothetical protein